MSDLSNDESEANSTGEPQEEEISGKPAITPLDSFATQEQALEYLDKKYSYRFTPEDPDFLEALERPFIPPPIVVDYTGRVKYSANRRSNNHHRFNNNNNNNNRRY